MSRSLLLISILVFAASYARAANVGSEIDEMTRKEAMADAAAAMITAESAFPHKAAEDNASVYSPVNMDDAVKMALANHAASKSKIESAVNPAGGETAKKSESEDQMPVFSNPVTAVAKTKSSGDKNFWWRMMGSLAIAAILGIGGIFAVKKMPAGKKIGKQRMIEVLSQHHLGPKRSLAVVRVAGETCLIGVTDHNISILKTLALLDDDVPAGTEEGEFETPAVVSRTDEKGLTKLFKKSLASSVGKAATYSRAEGPTKMNVKAAVEKISDEEFTMQGLREIVGERLKTMKEL